MELLTGKCREDFKNWYKQNVPEEYIIFQEMYLSLQYGVIVDFFSNSGLHIQVEPILTYTDELLCYMAYVNDKQVCTEELEYEFDIRGKARVEAIKKANQIYNENNK